MKIRRYIGWFIVGLLLLLVLFWYFQRAALPFRITIASAKTGGLYHELATVLAPALEEETGRSVIVEPTEGSRDNRERLMRGRADLAVIQSGSVDMSGLEVLAPLYHDVVLVIVRANLDVRDVQGLVARSVSIGPEASGMRSTAEALLAHFGLRVEVDFTARDDYFMALDTDPTLDAAIVTTGLLNPDLQKLLGTGGYEIVPIMDADAFCLRHPAFEPFAVPRGLYSERPRVPAARIPTVATMAILAAREGVTDRMVNATMRALYEHDLRAQLATLVTADDAPGQTPLPLHPVAARYYDPYGGIDKLASFMESIAAGKELLFAAGAGFYLLWRRMRKAKQRRADLVVEAMKEHLDGFLAETARIERAQMECTDVEQLEQFLDEVTTIKLRALDELTHEDLRGDRMFLIFLLQCGNLISKIQAKIQLRQASAPR